MSLIRSAIVYRVKLPSAEILEKHLGEFPFHELAPGDQVGTGFTPVPTISEGELVTPFPGGVAFAVRQDVKAIPGALVSVLVDVVEKLCTLFGYKAPVGSAA